jgi:hypothetical protein
MHGSTQHFVAQQSMTKHQGNAQRSWHNTSPPTADSLWATFIVRQHVQSSLSRNPYALPITLSGHQDVTFPSHPIPHTTTHRRPCTSSSRHHPRGALSWVVNVLMSNNRLLQAACIQYLKLLLSHPLLHCIGHISAYDDTTSSSGSATHPCHYSCCRSPATTIG